MWFLNGLLLGLLIMCVFIIYANANRPKKKVRRLPRDHHSIEYKNGTLSFDGMPGYQNIPCRIEIIIRSGTVMTQGAASRKNIPL